MVDTITTLAGIATLAVAALIAGIVVLWAAARFSPGAAAAQGRLIDYLGGQSLWLAWLVAVAATVGSLYYSDVVGFEPCSLCWYQRIALYPLVVILPVGAVTKDRFLARYALPLTAAGAVLAVYNYLVELFPGIEVACSTTVSCSTAYVEAFGWLTLPLMSAVAFAAITAGILYDRAAYRRAEALD
ncbi:MAG: disulfide bond formation protein B [Acidimicrobiia bacterium]|nr:disulfide bond formation protein B [Acidimicrobiia bacterium]